MDEYLYKTDDIFADQEAEENIIGCTDWELDNPWKDTWIDARYRVVKVLGEGSFGTVLLVIDGFNESLYAIKIPKSKEAEEILTKEIENMQKINSEQTDGMVKLLGFNIRGGAVMTYTGKILYDEFSYFITNFSKEGDLALHIFNNEEKYQQGISEISIFQIFNQLLGGTETIHRKGFVHLDLKPDNILIFSNFKVAISDFALCKPIDGEDGQGNFLNFRGGSKQYWSPEMFTSLPYNGVNSDLYSLGIILFIITFGGLPFQYSNHDDFYFNIMINNPINFWKTHPEASRRISENTVSPDLIKLINHMLCPYPNLRLSIEKIKTQKWFKNMSNLSNFNGKCVDNNLSEKVQNIDMNSTEAEYGDLFIGKFATPLFIDDDNAKYDGLFSE